VTTMMTAKRVAVVEVRLAAVVVLAAVAVQAVVLAVVLVCRGQQRFTGRWQL